MPEMWSLDALCQRLCSSFTTAPGNIREGQGSLIGDLEEEEGAQALGPGALRAAVTSTAGEPWESPSLGQEPVKSKLLRLGVLVCSRSSVGHSNTGQG